MNQKLLSGLAAVLMVSGLGLMPSSYADPAKTTDEHSSEQVPESGVSASSIASASLLTAPAAPDQEPEAIPAGEQSADAGVKVSAPSEAPSPVATTSPADASVSVLSPPEALSPDPVKVGEYQSQENAAPAATVATIQSHQLRGRNAATLYVRNIPVLTFLGDAAEQVNSPSAPTQATAETEANGAEVKVASVQSASVQSASVQSASVQSASVQSASVQSASVQSASVQSTTGTAASASTEAEKQAALAPSSPTTDATDPVWRATATAARLNQLYRDNVNADSIKIVWDEDRKQYVINTGEVEVVALDDDTVLPDTVGSTANDVLQATNRIRRQMGNAAPLASIEGDPNGYREVNLGPVSLRASGYASWYGPGFDGNYSASGEIFNARALTAAHPSLPFGTQVRVTNLDNGQSVVVRINDRGPYSHGRIIDLSAGAAQVIGLIASGVAPVSLEVLGTAQSALQD